MSPRDPVYSGGDQHCGGGHPRGAGLSGWTALDVLAAYLFCVKAILPVLAALIAASGLDDLFVDALFLGRILYRRLFVYTRFTRATASDISRWEERWFAILVPAWDEAAVIRPMLESLVGRMDYARYRVFVGVYPNDPATIQAVARVTRRHPAIVPVTTRQAGPTSKADCLNSLWRELLRHERLGGFRFAGVVLHDAEDVCHPRELKLFNHLIDRFDLIQLPVVPLAESHSRWISGHYLDDFAEAHTKDMVVREMLGAAMPCAGVGCAFSRAAVERAAARNGGAPFNEGSVTEDYILGIEASLSGGRPAMVRVPVTPGGRGHIATRAFFPDTLDRAVRQKARWLAGITLQGWSRLGWPGRLADRYMLLRDRKALLTAYAGAAAYLAALHLTALWLAPRLWPAAPRFPALIEPGGIGEALILLNLALLLWRLAMRAALTAHTYGAAEGLRSIPRAFVANAINFLAAGRALRLYWRARRSGRIAWDKTSHHFPDASVVTDAA